MLNQTRDHDSQINIDVVREHSQTPPVPIPPGHIGPVVLPGTGRLIYWTGRVAIGLRHQPNDYDAAYSQSALWVQDLMLDGRHRRAA